MDEKAKVRRIYTWKKPGCDIEAAGLLHDLKQNLGMTGLLALRLFNRYDVSGLTRAQYDLARTQVFSEPPVDSLADETCDFGKPDFLVAVEALPGQYDQRADSAAQCLQIMTGQERPLCKTARIYAFHGELDKSEKEAVKRWLINPVEAREASLDKPASLADDLDEPEPIETVADFRTKDDRSRDQLIASGGLAMSRADLAFIQDWYRKEGRDPTWTELRVLDTYWSDHCRHTTFLTEIEHVTFPDDLFGRHLREEWDFYESLRRSVHQDRLKEKPPCLMDLATLAMKELRQRGKLDDLDVSGEINACSIRVTIPVDNKPTEYLVMFKNETHNHPTEIEPFGGAATCIGGAIRDPLSGRSYVYQAMRVTGSGDPTRPVSETLPGKLPQRKITTTAAAGYSSYGNQVGLATGHVDELYHPGYIAKRMEIGAVIGAVPASQVRREVPEPGDRVILIGGRTGRDGCGGATGSSKAHDEHSLARCGSEVQKGNPPTERKIQRLFMDPDVTRLIKRCNDFGAGGVSVAIGELADGLRIDLDRVPKKYAGLDGTELAISESQERMAVVVAASDVDRLTAAADRENLEATEVAEVIKDPRMIMTWRGRVIVDLDRSFIDTNGAPQKTQALLTSPDFESHWFDQTARQQAKHNDFKSNLLAGLSSLSGCSRRGLVERFDSTIGAGTLLMPLGGKKQLTPEIGMAALIPVGVSQVTDACSLMAFGFDPALSEWSPYHGAAYAVLESLARITAMGGEAEKARLSFQEYFRRMEKPEDWGQPLAALLGALRAQIDCGIPSIGGKDSMSGSFNDLHVPPTLVSFAVQVSRAQTVLGATIDQAGRSVWLLPVPLDPEKLIWRLPHYKAFMDQMACVRRLNEAGSLAAAATVGRNGAAVTCVRMCFGNGLGFVFDQTAPVDWFAPQPGALLLAAKTEAADRDLKKRGAIKIGQTTAEDRIVFNDQSMAVSDALEAWNKTLESVFPTHADLDRIEPDISLKAAEPDIRRKARPAWHKPKPRVFIPVFPGTNCEIDSARALIRAGAEPDLLVVRNNTPQAIHETIEAVAKQIRNAQMIFLPGGFSAGDEPEGSGKFIAATFRNPLIAEAIHDLLDRRDGLILGICNGFQALIKLGLLPFGKIHDLDENSPTLTFNRIGRHVSRMVRTRVVSNRSPWLQFSEPGTCHTVAVSHGEGRFMAPVDLIEALAGKGQIATQYVDDQEKPSRLTKWNPNGSMAAIEGLTSPDGRILGKMGHSERFGPLLYRNIPGEKDQQLFKGGVAWFS